MLVASNTSPISNLAIIGRLHLLRTQFHEIRIPRAVKVELDRLGYPSALKEIQQALGEGWIKLRPLREDKIARLLEATLDPGEAEAIALALELQADVVLLDETDGRSAAESAGLRVTAYSECCCRPRKKARSNWLGPSWRHCVVARASLCRRDCKTTS